LSLPLISRFRGAAEAQSIPGSVGPWTPLFNGRSFDGWDHFQEGIGTTDKTNAAIVHDGMIHMLGPTHISVALNGDGKMLAVGATKENSTAKGVNGNQDDKSALNAGAAYVYY